MTRDELKREIAECEAILADHLDNVGYYEISMMTCDEEDAYERRWIAIGELARINAVS